MIKVTTSSISAEVILKSESGRSMASSDIPITSENIEEFQPSEQVTKDATNRFKQLGFAVFSNGLTLTIEGEKSLFEKVFKVKLTLEKNGRTGRIEVRSDKQLSIPDSLSDIVEKVVFTPPPEFFS
jgi:subtilase family serine protease